MRSILVAVGLAFLPLLGVGQTAAPLRDVLASAFLYPFVTDAEVLERASDVEARIATAGGRVVFRYPGIAGVRVGGQAIPGQRLGNDLWSGDFPAGTHAVTLVVGEGGPPVVRVPQPGAVATVAEFQARAEQLRPGDELVVADGIYADWRVKVVAQGTAEAPILIRPETPGGVTLRLNSSIRIEGQHVVLKGFRFDHCGPNAAVHLVNAADCRITQCQFFSCGNPISTFYHILRVDAACHRNRVDHCYFTGSKSMSIGHRVSTQIEIGTHNQFDRNVFRDIYRYWVNGQRTFRSGRT
ncbi:MAG: chondroitinase-B domain-containing protein, partial [Lentisphaeria bacterium]|nr:chondroitinase-B domain-containing protein [Lentisphaeria bacterium]